MAETSSEQKVDGGSRSLKLTAVFALVTLLAAASFLIAGRGEAILIDLFAASKQFLCL